MMRLRIIIIIMLSLVSVVKSLNGKLPNFIIMLMDDMGWGDLGCNGEPSRETPYLDRLAAEGITVTSMYTAAPLCSPSRASLLTGRLPLRNGFYSNNEPGRNAYTPQNIMGGISSDEVLLPELLKKKNYTNVLIGKWHLGHQEKYLPLQHGFHHYYGAPNCHFGPYDDKTTPNIPVFRDNQMIGRYYEEFSINRETGESNMTKLLTNEAVAFITSSAAKEEPFFMLWTPDSTHAPTYASNPYLGSSRRGRYGASVRELDDAVGRIVYTLKELHIQNNTLVVFTSDNGPALVSKLEGGSNGPFLCGKQTTFEGGMRVPGIFWWPGVVPAGTVSHQVWSQMDLFSTVLQFAGIDPPDDRYIDGWALANSLQHPNLEVFRSVFLYRGDRLMAVRRYKIHLWTWNTSPQELHNGIDYCPGQRIDNVTTTAPTDHRDLPIMYDITADQGEKYPLTPHTELYNSTLFIFRKVVHEHEKDMVSGDPQLNWCDNAVMHWAPPGCEKIHKCLPRPVSKPHHCNWPH